MPGANPQLHIRGLFHLDNIGNGDLPFIDAIFPDEIAFGRRNLRLQVDGVDVVPTGLPDAYQREQPNALRIPFDPPWVRKRVLELTIDYDLSSPQDSGSQITLGPDNFHLSSRGWFPALQPPKHLFAPYPKRPKITTLTIRVPSGFLLLARGTQKGTKKYAGETAFQFAVLRDDLPPYIVAGRYVTFPSKSDSHSAALWTLQPAKEDPQPALNEITRAWKVLETDFGPIDRNISAPHIVESSELRGHTPGEQGPAATPFPGGVLVNPDAFALGIGSDRFLEMITHSLAHNWFGDEMYPAADAAIGMGEGLPEYATIVIEEARNGPDGRRRRVARYLREYDEARKNVDEEPLGATMLRDPVEKRRIAAAKAALFFVALEDACGEEPMRSGLRTMVTLLRGQEASYDSLRSALEQSSGKNLGELFRVWLNAKGIPQDFRDRYQ